MRLQDLANAGQTKRPTSCLLILPKPVKPGPPGSVDEDEAEVTALYDDVHSRVAKLGEAAL